MEKERIRVSSRRRSYYANKVRRAVHLLFYRRHKKPGVKGWELQKALGAEYPKILKILDRHLKPLDLQVKTVFEGEEPTGDPTLNQLNKARFCITLRGELTPQESKMIGWRIDDLAGLAMTVAYVISRKGKAPRKEIEELLRDKLPGWKVGVNVDRYIRYGYLAQDENEQLYLDWRTNTEVDQRALIDLVLSAETQI